MTKTIYHLCRADEWQSAVVTGTYGGSSQDLADGFIHFSTADQVRDSAARHRAGQEGLVLLGVAVAFLGDSLRWEPAKSGEVFPHLYGSLPITAVVSVDDLPLHPDGYHRFPQLED